MPATGCCRRSPPSDCARRWDCSTACARRATRALLGVSLRVSMRCVLITNAPSRTRSRPALRSAMRYSMRTRRCESRSGWHRHATSGCFSRATSPADLVATRRACLFGHHPGVPLAIKTPTCSSAHSSHGWRRPTAPTRRCATRQKASLEFTLARQRPTAPCHGERADLEWIDGLPHRLRASTRSPTTPTANTCRGRRGRVARGVESYRRRLFLADGLQQILRRPAFPIDHRGRQGTRCSPAAAAPRRGPARGALARVRVRAPANAAPRRPAVFQRRWRFWVNRIPHVRWVVAPMPLP